MENLEKHIADLLETHDCVVIPDFGGFLLNRKPAGFALQPNELYPPSKAVSFNRSLNVNDGLLLQHICREENFTYSEALLKLADVVDLLKRNLMNGEFVKFQGVGTLFQDGERKIIFKPDNSRNYLRDAFGLPALLLSPVEKQAPAKIYHLPERRLRSAPVKPIRVERIVNIVSIAASLIIVLIIFFKNVQISQTEVARTVNSVHARMKPLASSMVQPQPNAPAVVPHAETPQTEIKTQGSTNSLKYYVVGGSFKKEANARVFEQQLKKKGFQARVLNTENGLYRVTYLQEPDSAKADHGLHKIKISENQSAWILKW